MDNTLIPKSKCHRLGKDLEVLKINTSLEGGRGGGEEEEGRGGEKKREEGGEEEEGALFLHGFHLWDPTKEENVIHSPVCIMEWELGRAVKGQPISGSWLDVGFVCPSECCLKISCDFLHLDVIPTEAFLGPQEKMVLILLPLPSALTGKHR